MPLQAVEGWSTDKACMSSGSARHTEALRGEGVLRHSPYAPHSYSPGSLNTGVPRSFLALPGESFSQSRPIAEAIER